MQYSCKLSKKIAVLDIRFSKFSCFLCTSVRQAEMSACMLSKFFKCIGDILFLLHTADIIICVHSKTQFQFRLLIKNEKGIVSLPQATGAYHNVYG